MNPELIRMDRFELERFLLVLELGLRVVQRYQFFSWAQGSLQGLLPHGLLICLTYAPGEHSFTIDRFSDSSFDESAFFAVCNSNNGILSKLVKRWEQSSNQALIFNQSSNQKTVIEDGIYRDLKHHGLGHSIVHGVRSLNGELLSFFCFCRVPHPLRLKHSYLLELLMPYLHHIWSHTQLDVKTKPLIQPCPDHLLSPREIEVLEYIRDGKTNAEIGAALHLSPFTVKNHVQNILHKFDVPNRAQAVAKGLALGICSMASD